MANLLTQDFEGAFGGLTYEGDTGDVNPAYTTGPLEGTRSCRLVDDDTEGVFAIHPKFSDDTGLAVTYFAQIVQVPNRPTGEAGGTFAGTAEILQFYNVQGALEEAGGEDITVGVVLRISSAGVLVLQDATSGGREDGSTVLATGTKYYLWVRATLFGGFHTITVYLSATPTRPGTAEITYSSLSETVVRFNTVGHTMFHDQGYEQLVDYVMVDNADYPVFPGAGGGAAPLSAGYGIRAVNR